MSRRAHKQSTQEATEIPSSLTDPTGLAESIGGGLSLPMLSRLIEDWMFAGQSMGWSKATLASRRIYTRNLIWFLKEKCEHPLASEDAEVPPVVDVRALRAFFAYLRIDDPQGRWGFCEGGKPKWTKGVSERTVETYHANINALFSWCEHEELLVPSPMRRVALKKPARKLIEPLSKTQVAMLLSEAGRSEQASRDVAIVSLLLDSGLRANELCTLRLDHLDTKAHK